MPTWKNNDGLRVKFGPEKAKNSRAGSPRDNKAVFHELVADIRHDEMPAIGVSDFLQGEPGAPIPKGYLIRSAKLVVIDAFTSAGAPTLTLGMSQEDDTVIDANGIDDAIALLDIDTVGKEVNCDGALIGTKISETGHLTLLKGVADYTAGRAKLIIEVMPL